MFPSFELLGKEISMYGVLGVTGILVSALWVALRDRGRVLSAWHIASLAAYAAIAGMIGAKILFLITQIGNIAADIGVMPWRYILMRYLLAGFVFYGGLIGALLGLWGYSRYMSLDFGAVLRLAVPTIPLLHGFGRIGCFLAGCCYGVACAPPLGIAFERSLSAPNGIHYLPVQLFEAAALFVIFGVLWWYVARRERSAGDILCLYLFLYTPVRFVLEFFRGDLERGFVWRMSTSQLISIALFLGALGYRLVWRRRAEAE